MPKINNVGNPLRAYEKLRTKTDSKIKKSIEINPIKFSKKVHTIGDAFIETKQRTALNNRYSEFAENLVSRGFNSLAGIIYSFLIKINRGNNTELVESFCIKALAIAKRLHDPVHIMARAKDLKEIYKVSEYGSERHSSMLRLMIKSLNTICNDYEKVQLRFCTVKKEMKPVEHYKVLLAETKLEIAEILKTKSPKEAAREIAEANKILEELKTCNQPVILRAISKFS